MTEFRCLSFVHLAMLIVAITCLFTLCATDNSEHEFVFAIPTLTKYEPRKSPRVIITTNSLDNVEVSLHIHDIGFEYSTDVNRMKEADIRLPYASRLDKGDEKQNKTIIVRASDTVSVFAIDNDFLQGDAFSVLSSSNLGTEYRVASFWHSPRDTGSPCAICISALQSNTVVQISTKNGLSREVVLNELESYRFDGDESEDLSGTSVTSSKPVSVVSGVFTMIPQDVEKGDGILEQMLPLEKWGASFVLAPFINKPSGYLYRVFAANYTTKLFISTEEVLIQPGEFYERDIKGDVVTTFITDHPVMVAQYMKGFSADMPGRGDPSMLIVPPTTSYTNNVTFPVFNNTYTDASNTYYINVIINCTQMNGLLFNDDIPMGNWEQLKAENLEQICVVRKSVSTGIHSVSHHDAGAKMSVSVYGICDDCGSSYVYATSLDFPNRTDECSLGLDNCHDNAHCLDTDTGYNCFCSTGFQGNGFQCEDINECSSENHNCDNNGDCYNFDGGYNCTCKTGFIGDGIQCKDKGPVTGNIVAIFLVTILCLLLLFVIIFTCHRRKKNKEEPAHVSQTVQIYDNKVSANDVRPDRGHEVINQGYLQDETVVHNPIAIVRGSHGTTVTFSEESKEYELSNTDKKSGYTTLVNDGRIISDYVTVIGEEESWEIEWRQLMLGKVILGKGNFGEVREGAVWYGEKAVKVAVKSLKDGTSLMEKKEFMDEFGTMTKIGRHPNIVALIGACENAGILYVALELIPHGNLRSFLRRLRDKDKEAQQVLTPQKLLAIAAEVANGMKHLERIKIIHRDLAARNVLLGEGYVAKISDFGLSRDEEIYMQTSKTRVPIRWMAPESIAFKTYTSATDVWSYGILLWEIGSLGGTPYANYETRSIGSVLNRGYRMPKPDNCTNEVYEIMEHCWKREPQSRPTFRDLHRAFSHMFNLNQVYMNVEESETTWLAPINQDRDDL